ncbi:DNA-processing protein DprA [Mycoplasmopsis alligatoris]|uniref:Smf/DprA SLOG domain-containing protein n=1 Tax=Mycoplasmopsis alligatoris A21JP2 TaxID=747682 RepID=D4XVU4_9BACT|nr:DNA-processing protein DprA [Mycoplasmopsis alligatoris]EFF41538.1 conserved hypothetical protein [Mycoplasmopsis alligatoris A21JP2]
MKDYLLYYSWINNGDNYKVFLSLKNKMPMDHEKLKTIKHYLTKNNINYITFVDVNYPEKLLVYKYPPYVIYYKGNYDILNKDNIYCITAEKVGQKTDEYFNQNKDILIKNTTLLTNLYKNFDQEINGYYKMHNKDIIRLFAYGFNWDKNEQGDIKMENELWISQYPPETHPKNHRFRERNLITAALAKELIIISSLQESKIIHLANYFSEIGKEVNCFPGISLDDGNNELIKMGANLITQISDVIVY